MELTNILGRLKSDSESPKPFLALELTDEVVQAAVWHVDDGITQIVKLGTAVEWKDGHGKDSQDNLVQAVDTTISTAIEDLPAEPNQIVFGLPATWITPDGIDKTKLQLIKIISRELELKPLGFVAIIDSLLRYLKMQEGIPSTSLLIHVTHDEVMVHNIVHGKAVSVKVVGRSDDIALDVEEGISRLKITGNLPSRIIVFDGMQDLEDIVQNLVSYDWQSKFKFLHLPKVESLPSDIIIKSIAIAGGAEVAKSIGFEIVDPEPPSSPPPTESTPPTADTPDFGFSDTPPPTARTIPDRKGNPDPGSSITNSIALTEPSKPSKKPLPKFQSLKTNSSWADKFTSFFQSLKTDPPWADKFPKINLGNKIIIIITTLLFITSLLATAYWFIPHATVTIYVNPKVLEENIPITLSTTATSVNPENSIVPASIVPTSVTGTDTVNTTGTKTIGDHASGEITIYNRTDLVKLFEKGTTINSGNLSFTLDDDVTIASSSAGADYVDIPGKATVAITADSIGEASNLAENTEFSIENYSSSTYIARNESALSGGTSNEISVVSQDDIDTLLDSLSVKLEEEARKKLLSSSTEGSGIFLLEDSFEFTDKSYSAELGQEASSLQGTIEVSVSALHYFTTDVEQLVASRIDQSITSDYLRTIDLPIVELSSAKSEGDSEVIAEAKVTVLLLPKLDQLNIQNTLRGLSTKNVKKALSEVVGLDSAYVTITPKFLPSRWKVMPRNINNITIKIVSTN